jgi:hypothetical protein
VALTEERDLSNAYRTTRNAPMPQGQGLNDLYNRFFRMAERRIVEMNQPCQGIISFIFQLFLASTAFPSRACVNAIWKSLTASALTV